MITAEDILKKKKGKSIISVNADSTVQDAITVMVKNNIGAVLISKNNQVIGIWTERDLLHNMNNKNFNPQTASISDFMVTELITASFDEPIYQLQDKFLGKHLRHLLIEKEGKYIGLLSAGDVTRASLNDKIQKLKSVSWDFYENWCWQNKR